MGRNNRIRSHKYIPKGRSKPKRSFNWKGLTNAGTQQQPKSAEALQAAAKYQKAALALDGCLLIMPWAVLFAAGVLI